jgi:hypothetical protein
MAWTFGGSDLIEVFSWGRPVSTGQLGFGIASREQRALQRKAINANKNKPVLALAA